MTLGKGRFPAAMEQCRERSEVSDRGRIFREVVKGQQLGPFEGPPILKPPALPGDSYLIPASKLEYSIDKSPRQTDLRPRKFEYS